MSEIKRSQICNHVKLSSKLIAVATQQFIFLHHLHSIPSNIWRALLSSSVRPDILLAVEKEILASEKAAFKL